MNEKQAEKFRQDVLYSASQYIGTFYRWGGKVLRTGLDCSGFSQLVLAKLGLMPSVPPLSSGMQYDFFRTRDLVYTEPYPSNLKLPGNVLFWGDNRGIHHVSFFVGNSPHPQYGDPKRESGIIMSNSDVVLDCGRGHQTTDNLLTAWSDKAGVQVRSAVEIPHELKGIVDIVEAWEAR